MTKSTTVKNKPRNQYTPEFREQVLALADSVGVDQAARELNLYESKPYMWRSKTRQQNNSGNAVVLIHQQEELPNRLPRNVAEGFSLNNH